MKKILIVIDSKGWAIDQLAQVKIKYNPHYEFKSIYVHPRDAASVGVQDNFRKTLLEFNPDIVHFEYFNSAKPLLDSVKELKNYKIILTHHNQKLKALGLTDWNKDGVSHIATHTNKCAYLLTEKYLYPKDRITVINHGIDLDFFQYNSNLIKTGNIGYCGRIVPWKGLKSILRCARKLNKMVVVMGKMDKADYWDEIVKEGLEQYVDFSFFNCPDSERINGYKSMEVFVNNSDDGLEEGPLPYLEAMACGVPVVTTKSGIAHELAKHEDNCLVTDFGDDAGLCENIERMLNDDDLKSKLRENAWTVVKNMSDRKMAREYDVLYQRVMCGKNELASVVIPTFNRWEQVNDVLLSLNDQTYKNFEVVLCDDNSEEDIKTNLFNIKDSLNYPVKYVKTNNSGYGLAQARNMGSIEAIGENLIFFDSRIKPDNDVIEKFSKLLKDNFAKIWFFGNKGSNKSTFVENFSAVKRHDFISFGMFCERIDKYGGLSEETRIRWTSQDGLMKYCPDVNAVQLLSTHKDNKRRLDIIEMKLKIHKMYNKQSSGYNTQLKYK